MNDQNDGYDSDLDYIVRILDMRASINAGVEAQTNRIQHLTNELKQLPCGSVRDYVLRELAARSDDLRLWTEIGQLFEDLPLRYPPEDPPIKGDEEIDAEGVPEAQAPEYSIEQEVTYITSRIRADLSKCQVARAEFEALTFCLTGKASYIGSMKHLVAEKRGLHFNEWLWSDIHDYTQFYSEMGWQNELCDNLLEQLFQALREVDAAETYYNQMWRSSAV